MASEQNLIEEMRRALHGVEMFLRQVLGDGTLSPQAQARGQSLRNVVNKVLEKTSSFGKPSPLSPSPSGTDLHTAPPELPTKPAAALPPPLEAIEVEVEQENYEAMDAIERPRLDTTGSLYAPMASVGREEDEAISEETYEAMAASPGNSGSGQFARPPPPSEDIANITEELYLEMDAASVTGAPAQKPPAHLPPKPGSDPAMSPGPPIQPLGVTAIEPGFEGEQYTAMSGVGQEEADDFYEAPASIPPSASPLGTAHGAVKVRAQTLPHASSQSSFDGADDDDAYHVPLSAQKTSAEALSSSTQKGYLDKLGGRGGKSWQKRFVALSDGALYYFESEKDRRPRNVVPIAGYRVEEDPEHSKGKKYAFKVTPLSADKTKNSSKAAAKGKGGKSYHFRANSFEERKEWVSALRASLVRANRRSQTFLDAAVDEPGGGSGSGSITSASSQLITEEGGEDFYEDPTAPQTKATSPIEPEQDDYLAPSEVKSPASPLPPAISADTYLPPVEVTKPRASSTFGIGKEIDTSNLGGESNPYASRKDANPYASRQQMRLPTPPAGENPYQSRKQAQALPKVPDANPYASRQQIKLPPVPDKTAAEVAPVAPRAPSTAAAPPTAVNTQAIYVQLPDAASVEDEVNPTSEKSRWLDDDRSHAEPTTIEICDVNDELEFAGREPTHGATSLAATAAQQPRRDDDDDDNDDHRPS